MSEGRTISEVGEEGFLRLMAPLFRRQTEGFPLPLGDDVAISPPTAPGFRTVWTVDSMVEGTHFRWWRNPLATPEALGRKLAASNLSDLASKGADPQYALLSLGLPPHATLDAIQAFLTGLVAELESHGARLIGGDTVSAPAWTLTLSLTGLLAEDLPIAARHRARPGHGVYITGNPGESGAGLCLLESESESESSDPAHLEMVRRHLVPSPRIDTGRRLLALRDISMMDVSDGVAHDAQAIAYRSGVAITLDEDLLRPSPALAITADFLNVDPMNLVYHGGEDFELLFTTGAPEAEVLAIDPIIRKIGTVEAGTGLFLRGGSRRIPLDPRNFEHFPQS
ncbi:MAG: thiamine-phosphate kinase [Candidatus Sumerlaeia bacterium]|nr:thiamine-phosphate kinase [Candidatus Sumerlaeia bacterium]